MTATIIDGKAIAAQVRRELAGRVLELGELGITPGLAFVLGGYGMAPTEGRERTRLRKTFRGLKVSH